MVGIEKIYKHPLVEKNEELKQINNFIDKLKKFFNDGEYVTIVTLLKNPTIEAYIKLLIENEDTEKRLNETWGLVDFLRAKIADMKRERDFLIFSEEEKAELKWLQKRAEEREGEIARLKEKISELTEGTITLPIETETETLALLAEMDIPKWQGAKNSTPSDPIEFYERHYASVKNRMYQFILRKQDGDLLKAMNQRVQYRKRTGEPKLMLSNFIKEKKQKTDQDAEKIKKITEVGKVVEAKRKRKYYDRKNK